MSNTKALNGLPTTNNALYKLQENNTTFVSNAFPLRRFVRSNLDRKLHIFAIFELSIIKVNILIFIRKKF